MEIKIGENIKSLRKKHNLTQEQLAEILGVTIGAVYKWEAGLSFPEIKLLTEIADFFEISIDALFGYQQQNGNIENRIKRIQRCILDRDLEKAASEAEKAIKKYPNNFETIYTSALMYQLKFNEEKDEHTLARSNELFQNAIRLLYQNTDNRIDKTTILNHIANNYLMAERTQQALEILEQNNVCNINSSLIGLTYAMKLKQPENAKPYLINSFGCIINDTIRTMAGMAFMYAQQNDERCMDAALWLCDFLDSIKQNIEYIAFTDKFKAVLWAQCAVWSADAGHYDKSEKYIKDAYLLCKQFDADPIYSMQGIKFMNERDAAVSYDGIGKTAIEAIDNIVFSPGSQSDADKYVKNIWEELKNGKATRQQH